MDGMPAELLLGREGHPPPTELVAAMPFTHSLLATGKGLGYHAKAAPPTVTMPRLKVRLTPLRVSYDFFFLLIKAVYYSD